MMFNVDPHIHYKRLARATETYPDVMCQGAKAVGLDAVVFTEHHQVMPAEQLAELNVKHAPIRIFQGVEITVWERRDYLVYGVPWDKVKMPRLKRISRRDLLDLTTAHNAAVCIAHPLCYADVWDVGSEWYENSRGECGIHAIEIASGYITIIRPSAIRAASAIGWRRGWTLLCGSDAHEPKHLSKWYSVAREPITTEAELVAAVKNPELWW